MIFVGDVDSAEGETDKELIRHSSLLDVNDDH